MTRTEMDAHLPGDPSKLIVRRVRQTLKLYGIMPKFGTWRLAWKWAAAVMNSYGGDMCLIGKPRKKNWPGASEIAAQYMALLLIDMRDGWALKLPHRAAKHLPPEVAAAVLASGMLGIWNKELPALPAKVN
jgi:hypothetical protein